MMNVPILIIGAGPVGMTMASELARYGVPIRIVDKAAHRTDKSKLWLSGAALSNCSTEVADQPRSLMLGDTEAVANYLDRLLRTKTD